jgi:ribonuclease HI
MVVDYGRTDAREKDAIQASVHLLPSRLWSKPPHGIIKLNVDGSFSASEGNGGAGMVIRDHNRDIKLSACRHLVSCSSPLEAELAACREGIALLQEHCNEQCILEMDCPEAVRLIKADGTDRSENSVVVQEIKLLLQSRRNIVLVAIDREQNNVSHTLANIGRTLARNMTWIGSGPDVVLAARLRDIAPKA